MPRRRVALLLAWVALLIASTGARLARPEPALAPGLRGEALPVFVGRQPTGDTARLAFRDWPGETAEAPLVLLVHGSPGDHTAMAGLAEALPARWRRVAPDMPGFGSSARDLPDYSIRAYGAALAALIDRLGARRAHLVVHSLGGGAALELYDQAPEKVASITMIAAIGAQEYELLGSWAANHAVHGLQLWGLRALRWGLPHFGLLDDAALGEAYARNFYDSDQRPLRAVLGRYDAPMLILHGEHDFLVPVEAAREHARLVPQSELVVDGSDHFQIFRDPAAMAATVDAFLGRVEAGTAITRAEADPARVAAAAAPVDPRTFPRAQGPTLLVLGGLLAAATLVSEDLACVTAGLLVAEGRLGIFAAILSCFLGIFVGDLGLLAAGRLIGRPLLRLPPLRWWVSEAAVDRASAWYRANGPTVIFTSRFMPGARLPLYVAAGLLRTPALRFAGWFALAGALWTPLLVGGSALVGARAETLLRDARGGLLWGALLAGAMVLGLRALVPLATWRGRRLALGWWRRQTRWEFWPMGRIYPTVVLHALRLAIRHRSLTVFTACNPGIPLGGVVGESKRDIYERLGGDANPRVPATLWLAAEEPAARRLELARAWRAARGLGWPLVVKPDAGQRGQGVVIARDEGTFEAAIAGAGCDTLVQEHVAGVEYGLFYVRRKGMARGELFSITEKRPLDVVGDGVSTLERLILADDRAVCMAPTHLARHAARLSEIPAAGERVRLVEIGTHSQGSVFLDAAPVATEALLEAVETLSQGLRGGFRFGRYDVRAASVDELRAGRFRVIECNGVTSEAVHIYDPKTPLREGLRVLREQWTIAFEIGAENAAAGAPVASVGEILRAWWAFRETARRHPRRSA